MDYITYMNKISKITSDYDYIVGVLEERKEEAYFIKDKIESLKVAKSEDRELEFKAKEMIKRTEKEIRILEAVLDI